MLIIIITVMKSKKGRGGKKMKETAVGMPLVPEDARTGVQREEDRKKGQQTA